MGKESGYFLTEEDKIELSGRKKEPYSAKNSELTAFSLKNFKVFRETGWIKINRLTLVCGANSSGKTALYKVLQMVKMSWDRLKRGDVFQNLSVMENEVGNYSELCNKQAANEAVVFSFRISLLDAVEEDLVYKIYLSPSEKNDYGVVSCVELENKNVCWDVLEYYESVNLFFLQQRERSIPIELQESVENIQTALRRFANTFQIVPAHRVIPERRMQLTGMMPKNLGVGGAYAYDILHTLSNLEDDRLPVLNNWLDKFGYSYRWKLQGKNSGEFLLRDNKTNTESNIVDNGFGISQSLPIAVAVMMSAGKILLIDSPEAFLQTKMQSEMGDLLLYGAKEGRIFAETGSEYILYRIRRRIAEGSVSTEDVSVYFIDENEENHAACYEMSISSDGEFENVPERFKEFFSSDFWDMETIDVLRMEKYRKGNLLYDENCD